MDNREDMENGLEPVDFKSEIFDWLEALVSALTVIILLFTFFIRLIGVDGNSMYPTLHHGDQLIVSHMFYSKPKAGDIVVLTKKSFLSDPIVKRVIATEGQTVDINFDTHEVMVDGEIVNEPFINEPTSNPINMTFPQTVPENCVFVMGDNRNHSSDSRDTRLGMVDSRYIIGRALVRIFPFNRAGLFFSADLG